VTEPKFSVVVAAYNAEATIGATLCSVLAQTRDDFEVVVVDDGSEDGTATVATASGDPRIRVVEQENAGTAAARNRGISESGAPLVAMLDSDDLWLPRYLETMGRLLEDNPHADLAYTDAWVLSDRLGRVGRRTAAAWARTPKPPPSEPERLFALLLHANFVFVSATVRRSALDEIGGFDRRCTQCEDYELWLRFARRGRRFVGAKSPLCVYRLRAGSKSSDEQRMLLGVREMFDLVLAEYELDDRVRPLVRARRDALDAQIARPTRRLSRASAIAAAKRALRPYLWPKTPPADVAQLLERCS
jgi:glycosyltransferase involved in cell wall biosynthesis